MKKVILGLVIVCGICSAVVPAQAEKASPKIPGEAKFKELCSVCHPDGGNIVKPDKTLHKKKLEANNIRTPADIVKVMRNPGPGMTKFGEKIIPNKEANEIAEYILKAFDK